MSIPACFDFSPCGWRAGLRRPAASGSWPCAADYGLEGVTGTAERGAHFPRPLHIAKDVGRLRVSRVVWDTQLFHAPARSRRFSRSAHTFQAPLCPPALLARSAPPLYPLAPPTRSTHWFSPTALPVIKRVAAFLNLWAGKGNRFSHCWLRPGKSLSRVRLWPWRPKLRVVIVIGDHLLY